ncbi:MAG TPA: acyl-CoA carboxylase epsilon subunit [Jiangellaceae bacterium]|nr:acyl-CoA carboxylase epsilon subunit [Jiangellaceae bacterium]HJU96709.1 acyl-CoA carboxylase epsilon subunit [Jiangellaceae bacterium]
MSESVEPPAVRVVKGEPTPDELAALVAAVAARRADESAQSERPSTWAAYWRSVRAPLRHGPTEWRDSARPR